MKRKLRFEELPEEIVEDILARLPLKSLIRFQCVCKAWCSRLRESRFASVYQKALESRHGRSMTLMHKTQGSVCHTVLVSDKATNRIVVAEEDTIHFPISPTKWINVVGSCNGIVCLRVCNRTALWNPTTRSFRIIRDSPVAESDALGFGYDAKADDYKVVWINKARIESIDRRSELVEIYSLRSNSWKKVSGYNYNDVARTGSWPPYAYTDGVYHWGTHICIISFDMREEKFTETELPAPLMSQLHKPGDYCVLSMTSFKGSLAVIIYNPELVERFFDIWVLTEVGVEESWTKQLRLGPFSRIISPLGFWNDDKMFMRTTTGETLMFDIKTEEFENLGACRGCYGARLFNYYPSLVYIKGRPEEEEGIFRDKDQD